eukprot:TRINITY_DN40730_c0_g1_i1.p1 TRINITY_DN40730_c0_g1~~TRINITY_DN40730_c0_g1_i1.p1  ORF type:complete len:526 (+),score=92.06 TRINITY_DN40730_c0_g1_i1:46-1623(+)
MDRDAMSSCSCLLPLLLTAVSASLQLPLGDINVMIVTDVHSWIAGHRHEPWLDATYGDVLSLYERTKEECHKQGKDLFFVMNGDINDGTGLSTDPPVQLVPLLEKMPWDALTIGNHELYKSVFVEYLTRRDGFANFWGDRYLTANVLNATTRRPLGRTHKFLEGQFGTILLALGFLYNMPDHDPAVEVLKVQDVVKQEWFRDLLSGKEKSFDAVLVLGHMDCQDPLVRVLLQAIRELQPNLPVQFVTGHSHARKFASLDAAATSFEAGHYLDTVGFASFPKKKATLSHASSASAVGFQHVFINGSVAEFRKVVGVRNLDTPAGRDLTKAIMDSRQNMGLRDSLGCAPMTFHQFLAPSKENSLWNLFLDRVIPDTIFRGAAAKVFVAGTGSMRYDLYEGNVTKDDVVTMMPFADEFWLVAPRVPGAMISAVLAELNREQQPTASWSDFALPNYLATSFDQTGFYELYGGTFDVGTRDRPGYFMKVLLAMARNMTIDPERHFAGRNTTSLWFEYVPRAWPCKAHVLI